MRTVRLIAALCGLFGLLGFSAEAQTPPTLNILGVSAFEGNPPATTVFGFTVVFSKASGQTTTFDVKTID